MISSFPDFATFLFAAFWTLVVSTDAVAALSSPASVAPRALVEEPENVVLLLPELVPTEVKSDVGLAVITLGLCDGTVLGSAEGLAVGGRVPRVGASVGGPEE